MAQGLSALCSICVAMFTASNHSLLTQPCVVVVMGGGGRGGEEGGGAQCAVTMPGPHLSKMINLSGSSSQMDSS
jgi:hypothetical protein